MRTGYTTSERKNAADLARKYFAKQIPKHHLNEFFPLQSNDFKIRKLKRLIEEEPLRMCFFGVSRKEYNEYLNTVGLLIEDLESDKMKVEIMQRFVRKLMIFSENTTKQIVSLRYLINEVAAGSDADRYDIYPYLNLLIDEGYLEKVGDESLVYQFTERGKLLLDPFLVESLVNKVS